MRALERVWDLAESEEERRDRRLRMMGMAGKGLQE
jgi:hypothetical protein